ncbi:penicillin-binding transpeptidase domain-containing protein [Ketobacter sp.]|uniref:penicillin-binding transpeptidase domain-containing protein n=1 Tax=Ketobacter sp. TaxID=2083498 RepID=UPI0025BAA2EB|nr:penicillin-binding transpeptidase domain-containing protein [Ketobacter sp.]
MNYFFALLLILVSGWVGAAGNPIAHLYQSKGITGSLLIESEEGAPRYEHNVNAAERFVPASTFKIPNTLIILQEGLLEGADDVITWDGVKREYDPWNQNQTLKTAFQRSCVWCYQRYALQVGDAKYRTYLAQFDYGNGLTGPDVSRFWLDGELRVSVQDQILFLRKVVNETLPIAPQHIKTLKDIMESDDRHGFKLWSKTGWSGRDGWFVGYLVVNGHTWYFANHIEIEQPSDLVFRQQLTLDAFRVLGIIQ